MFLYFVSRALKITFTFWIICVTLSIHYRRYVISIISRSDKNKEKVYYNSDICEI